MKTTVRSYFFAIAFFCCVLPVRAGVAHYEGAALITSTGISFARQAAIEDAKNKVMLKNGVALEVSNSVSTKGVSLESSRIRTISSALHVTVVQEWQVQDIFYVKVMSDSQQTERDVRTGQRYKRKITSTLFNIRNSSQTQDIDNIASELPRELLRRLENSNNFLVKVTEYGAPSLSALADTSQGSNDVRRISAMYGSQFVVSGEVIDAGNSVNDGLLRSGKRVIEVDFMIHDGSTGFLLARHRLTRHVEGKTTIGRNKPFGSASFFSTDFGQAIDNVIADAVRLISKDMEQIPFSARVIRISENNIYIDAGSTSFIEPGDSLVAYNLKKEFIYTNALAGSSDIEVETPMASVSIIQVQPLFSIGILLPGSGDVKIKVGDIVRFDKTGFKN